MKYFGVCCGGECAPHTDTDLFNCQCAFPEADRLGGTYEYEYCVYAYSCEQGYKMWPTPQGYKM